ncbi:lasso peptide isopeptide bond-forming cyclase [Frankia sp. Cr1]|uniref:lasso peptide isopeptide bond-forming cyclase n=1 Tax=Frankia sp. Cr1 TaxID=3073931 RepID=UPI002AD3D9A4|nr:lasso peptide isopeptide bond-forming cyclase [Frankia sp. Cr1]
MTGFPTLPTGTPWFVVLPDSGVAAAVAAEITDHATESVRYDSGRPWLLGDWPRDGIVTAVTGRSRITLIGCCPVDAAYLTRVLERTRDVASLNTLACSLPGSFHIIAEIDGRRRVQGTASGTRRVFYVVVDDQVIAADRADVLAAVTGGELDMHAVALALLDPIAPYPLDDQPMWRNIEAVPSDHFLLVAENGRPSRIRWWRQPDPVLPLAQGARLLRHALTEAVGVRAGMGGTVSSDLSGGLDSTSLCFLAARHPIALVAYTGIGRDPGDDDAEWAALAIENLPTAVHEILPREDLPLVYDGIATTDEQLDRPFIGIIDRAKMLAGFHRLAPYQPRVHLTGLGGDEVLEGAPNYLYTLVRRRPWTAFDRLRGLRAHNRWPLPASLWMMLRPRSYHAALSDVAAQVTGSGRRQPLPDLDWAAAPRLAPWVTADGVCLVREAFDAVLGSARPLAGTRDQHCDILSIRSGAGAVRLFSQLAAPSRIPIAAPFLDDRVIEASLMVRPEERSTPWEYKPLLKEAMHGIVPAVSLGRVTKAEGSTEEEAGLSANRDWLLALSENSMLAALGLVDAEKLRAGCRYSHGPSLAHEPLQQTFACEMWLRVLAGDRTVKAQPTQA